jgi:HAMP domain-containing protein
MVAFEIVVVVVCVASAVIAAVTFARAARLYDKIGALGTLGMSHDAEQTAATRAIVREEVRQMADAISALRAEKGESSLPPDGQPPTANLIPGRHR